METEEGDDPLNPFTKQGLSQGSRSGKRKVVSEIFDLKITSIDFRALPEEICFVS